MAYGALIQNANGKTLIAEGELAPTFRGKYSVSAGSAVATGTIVTSIASTEKFCMPFSRGPCWLNVTISGGFYRVSWRLLANNTGTVYVFGPPIRANSVYGIQVFNADGSLAYQNNGSSMRLIGFNPSVGTKYSGKQVAIMSRVISVIHAGPNGTSDWTTAKAVGVITTSGTDTIGYYTALDIPSAVNIGVSSVNMPLIDVTGL